VRQQTDAPTIARPCERQRFSLPTYVRWAWISATVAYSARLKYFRAASKEGEGQDYEHHAYE